MPNHAIRRISGATLAGALAAAALAANAPQASAAGTPSLRVLTYNTFIFSKTG